MNDPQRPPDDPLPSNADDDGSHADLASTARSRSWLWPAVGFIAILVVVVVIGRLGQTPGETLPASSPGTPAAIIPDRSLTPVAHPGGTTGAGLPGYPIGIRADGERYVDGIPATLDSNQVVRVRDAAALPAGSTVLVGGWTQRSSCAGLIDRCPLVISDAPFQSSDTITLSLAGQAAFDDDPGPHIFQATVQDSGCSLNSGDACLPELTVGDTLWSSDAATDTQPISSSVLLADLAAKFPTLHFRPFQEASFCPVTWPYQSYLVSSPEVPRALWTGLPLRLVVIYGDPGQLSVDGTASRAAADAMSAFDASNRCVSIPGGVNDAAWVVNHNAMVLTGLDPSATTQIRAILAQDSPT